MPFNPYLKDLDSQGGMGATGKNYADYPDDDDTSTLPPKCDGDPAPDPRRKAADPGKDNRILNKVCLDQVERRRPSTGWDLESRDCDIKTSNSESKTHALTS
eukprot:jgi/Psemu1/26797/gm1.26797_g